jgi:hypothetical protein
MSSSTRSKGKGTKRERDEQDGDVTPEQDGDVTSENGGNEILKAFLRKRQSTGNRRFQQSEEGTPNSIVTTNHRSTQSEFQLI